MRLFVFIRSILKRTFYFVTQRKGKKYAVKFVNDFPEKCSSHLLYVISSQEKQWLAGLKCPCGCGDFIELVLEGYSPCWILTTASDGAPSLRPSVFRSVGCRSHFFLSRGAIKWC